MRNVLSGSGHRDVYKRQELEDVFEAGIECSSKAMYPDWLSLTGEGYVPSMYKKYGAIISPMGCRAFLSPWYERGGMKPADEEDKPVFIGRWNIGAVSLHLPMIYAKAQQENRDFYEVLDYYLELIRRLHKMCIRDRRKGCDIKCKREKRQNSSCCSAVFRRD